MFSWEWCGSQEALFAARMLHQIWWGGGTRGPQLIVQLRRQIKAPLLHTCCRYLWWKMTGRVFIVNSISRLVILQACKLLNSSFEVDLNLCAQWLPLASTIPNRCVWCGNMKSRFSLHIYIDRNIPPQSVGSCICIFPLLLLSLRSGSWTGRDHQSYQLHLLPRLTCHWFTRLPSARLHLYSNLVWSLSRYRYSATLWC